MQVKEAMSERAEYIPVGCTLREAAEKMRKLDCGFLPIGDPGEDRLQGVITDRDIVIRAVAEGMNPETATVEQCKSGKVLYCFEDDDVEIAAKSMQEQHVYRLIVLDNPQDKRLCGIVSLGDLMRNDQEQLVTRAAKSITAMAA